MSIDWPFLIGFIYPKERKEKDPRLFRRLFILAVLLSALPAMAQLEVRLMKSSDLDLYRNRVEIYTSESFRYMESVPQLSEFLAKFGVRFDSPAGSYLRMGWYLHGGILGPRPFIENASQSGSSADKPFTIRFRYPVRIVCMNLAAEYTSGYVSATIRAYTPSGELIGERKDVEFAPNIPWYNDFFISSDHPEGIAVLNIDYGSDTRPERMEIVGSVMWLDYLEDRPFRLFLPHIVDGKSGHLSYKTTIRAQKYYTTQDVSFRFFDPSGNPLSLPIDGERKSEIQIAGNLTNSFPLVFQTDGTDPYLNIGWAIAESRIPLEIQAVYSTFSSRQELLSESAIPAVRSRFHQGLAMQRNVSKGIDTAIAIANVSDHDNRIVLSAYKGDRENPTTVISTSILLKPREQRAFFLSEVCRAEPSKSCFIEDVFQGSLGVSGSYPAAAIALGSVNGTLTYPLLSTSSEE